MSRVARWFLFKPKIPHLGKFWRALVWKMVIYFMALGNSLQTLGICHDHWVHFVFVWYIFHSFGKSYQKNLAALPPTRLGKNGRA
jgi:hypothetical protein